MVNSSQNRLNAVQVDASDSGVSAQYMVTRVFCFVSTLSKNSKILILDPSPKHHADWVSKIFNHSYELIFQKKAQSIEDLEELLDTPEQQYDLIYVPYLFAEIEYDRWAFQILHRSLKENGRVFAVIPNKVSIKGILAHVTKAHPKELRYYYIPRLLSRIEPLGFRVKRRFSFLNAFIKSFTLLEAARQKISSLDVHDFKQKFENQHRQYFSIQKKWLTQHSEYSLRKVAPIDLESILGKSVLILAPHPDDEIIGCGGTALRMIESGVKVSVLYATNGWISAALDRMVDEEKFSIRHRDAARVATEAKFNATYYWSDREPRLIHSKKNIESLKELLLTLKPSLIFVPFITDLHPDHIALNQILKDSLKLVEQLNARILCYEVWGFAPFNAYCDISQKMSQKEKLLFMYKTEMRIDDYVNQCKALARYNSLSLNNQKGSFEAFLDVSIEEYLKF